MKRLLLLAVLCLGCGVPEAPSPDQAFGKGELFGIGSGDRLVFPRWGDPIDLWMTAYLDGNSELAAVSEGLPASGVAFRLPPGVADRLQLRVGDTTIPWPEIRKQWGLQLAVGLVKEPIRYDNDKRVDVRAYTVSLDLLGLPVHERDKVRLVFRSGVFATLFDLANIVPTGSGPHTVSRDLGIATGVFAALEMQWRPTAGNGFFVAETDWGVAYFHANEAVHQHHQSPGLIFADGFLALGYGQHHDNFSWKALIGAKHWSNAGLGEHNAGLDSPVTLKVVLEFR
ncbi:MAG: acyloxyacyl hydrolase [Deltaproteobacteria bacterium]|nr:acyloxyacyl hydrolase [Deltaproteobacteria bacterium]